MLPIGGGGLASGIAIALRELRPGVAHRRRAGGEDRAGTIADGIAVKHPGELTMSILNELLDEIVHVEDEEITDAITMLLERAKLVVEGAGAASVAALISGKAGGKGDACALMSGGNIDPTLLISVIRHGLTRAGRYLVIRTRIPDRPGALVSCSSSSPTSVATRLRRAPPRGHGDPRRRDRGRADRGHAQRGALRRLCTALEAAGLPARPPALIGLPSSMIVCQTCGRESPADARFCASCGSPLAAPSQAREERKVVSVVFVDLVGHTALGERRSGGRPRDAAPYYARARDELERFGGTVEKFIGDAVMAVFGAPSRTRTTPSAPCARRSPFATRSSRTASNRAAVNTGEALVSLDANAAEGEALVAGDVVNTAARLQSAAPVNGVLVGEARIVRPNG